jgi:iron complex outermembrane receptor protein
MDIGDWGFMTARANYAYRDEMAYTDSNLGYIDDIDTVATLSYRTLSDQWQREELFHR